MPGLSQLRITAGLSAGALAVHELRYRLAYGNDAAAALQHQGHAYLNVATPVIGMVLACLLGHLLHSLCARTERHGGPAPSRLVAGVGFASGLLAIYTAQELLEGVLATGHPPGLAGVFGHGGWLAVPLSALVGAGLSLLVKVVRAVAARARVAGRVSPIAVPAGGVAMPPAVVSSPRGALLARHLAGRAPPV